MGSGHILVYAFDVLYDIYKSAGYSERDIPKLILENNLYGLDIDDRATQLAYFAVMMKARSKSRRIFREKVNVNVCAIQESNGIPKEAIDYFARGGSYITDSSLKRAIRDKLMESVLEKNLDSLSNMNLKQQTEYLIDLFHDAKEYGSILEVKPISFDVVERRLEEIRTSDTGNLFEYQYRNIVLEKMPTLVKQARIMSQKYDVVCTNPPYMGRNNVNIKLKNYLDNNFPNSADDLFAVFIERNLDYIKNDYFVSMITQHSWMYLPKYESLRNKVINLSYINSLVHLGARAFEEIGGEVVQTASFIIRKHRNNEYNAKYIRLVDKNDAQQKENEFFNFNNMYCCKQKKFVKIPNHPLAYWISSKIEYIYEVGRRLDSLGTPCKGIGTGDNNRFLKLWFEIDKCKFATFIRSYKDATRSNYKWFKYNKGGPYRKWYGNNEYVINWDNDGFEVRKQPNSYIRNEEMFSKSGLTWTKVTSFGFCIRYFDSGFLFDDAGCCFFSQSNENQNYYLGLLNSKIFNAIGGFGHSLTYQVGDIGKLPIIFPSSNKVISELNSFVIDCINISKSDWNSFETSWDFQRHPLLTYKRDSTTIKEAFNSWTAFTEKQFKQLKANEEELNRIFIEIYGLQDELIALSGGLF